MSTLFHKDTLPQGTAKLFKNIELAQPSFLQDFYLSGGTALSLQLGHRESEDLDFFTEQDFDPRNIQVELEKIGKLSDIELDQNTLNGYLDTVKVQFLRYPYPLIDPVVNIGGIKLSSVIDIACTKLQTIGMRGSKKDFVDMFILLQKYPLTELITKLKEKYQQTQYNLPHILKSLVYFVDAEDQAMPRLHQKITWNQVKEKMIEVIKEINL